MVGDADVRNIVDGAAEIAIQIAARGQQGRGLGTRFAVMIHAFAFRTLELARMYISLIPVNVASRRLFEKLGYTLDDSPQARAFIDEESDLTMSLDRPSFESARHKDVSEIRFSRGGRPGRAPAIRTAWW
jgi:RimJ/RimL family protein N-acetyltransferase